MKNQVQTNIIINKSEFINYLVPVHSISEVDFELESIKKSHPDANHHCYAYILGDHQEIQKYSDDGEPSKTAGFPMLEVLKKHDLTDVLVVSVRYFGGIKLGAGGLVRAYTKSCASCIKEMVPAYKESFTTLEISVPFEMIGVCEKHIRDSYTLLDTIYDTLVHYQIVIPTIEVFEVETVIQDKTNGVAQTRQIEVIEKYV